MGDGGYPRLVNDSCWGSRITCCAPGLADGWHLRGSGRGASEIAAMLGFAEQDNRWCTPWGEDVTYLCEFSGIGGFGSKAWTIHGWIFDDSSMRALKEEYPDECLERLEQR